MFTQLRSWWFTGSVLWRRLVVCWTLAVTTFIAALVMSVLDASFRFASALTVVAAAAGAAGGYLWVTARRDGRHAYSPRWYRQMRQAAEARARRSA